MPFSCGCELYGGKPIGVEQLKAHYKHTLEVLIFWDLLHGPGGQRTTSDLQVARCDYVELLDKTFPEAVDL